MPGRFLHFPKFFPDKLSKGKVIINEDFMVFNTFNKDNCLG